MKVRYCRTPDCKIFAEGHGGKTFDLRCAYCGQSTYENPRRFPRLKVNRTPLGRRIYDPGPSTMAPEGSRGTITNPYQAGLPGLGKRKGWRSRG